MKYEFQPGTPGVYNISVLESFIHSLPNEDEQYNSMILLNSLVNLNGLVNDFAAAVALYDHVFGLRQSVHNVGDAELLTFTKTMNLLNIWYDIAGREAAMTVYHIGKALEAIRSNLRSAPTIKADVIDDMLRKASSGLQRAFPNYSSVRNAVGHRAEIFATLDDVKRHAIDIEGGRQFVWGVMEGRDYVVTYKKVKARVSLTDEACRELNAIVATVYSAFPAIKHLLPPLV